MERNVRIELRVSEEELARFKAAAGQSGRKSLSKFIRDGVAALCDRIERAGQSAPPAGEAEAPQPQAELSMDVPARTEEVVGTSIGEIAEGLTFWKGKMRRYTDTHWEDDDGSWKPFVEAVSRIADIL